MTGVSLRHRLALLFVIAGFVVVLFTVLVATTLVHLDRAARDHVDRYAPAQLEAEALARAYYDQEAALRGYLVSGRDSVLAPYDDGREVERRALARLDRLLVAQPELLARVAAVRDAADGWREQVAEPGISRVRADGPRDLTARELAAGERRFDRVRRELADLQQPLEDQSQRAAAALRTDVGRLRVVLLAVLAGLVVAAALAWHALRLWVVAPLRELGTEVDRVEAGDLSRRVSVESAPAEIADLAGQVEQMRVRILHEYALAEESRAEALRAQARIEEQAEDLRRSNAELEQFAYVASHDLQEPLRKVASFCQLIERRYKGQLDERGEQYIEFAVDGAKRMQQLINDLLAFSRVGRNTGDFEPVALEDVLAQTVRQLSGLLDENDAVVTHDPLPVVQGDASLLVQLLQNLIGNGVKFRSDEAPRVHVTTRSVEDGLVEVTCTDNGIGIDPQYEDKIFVIFQRLHGRDAYGGTGIGLAMCKKIVEFHGGRLWLDKQETSSAGSTFRFTLPLAPSDGRSAS